MRSRGRHFFYRMRNEGAGAVRESIAIGLGLLIGCLPVFGLHLALCFVVGWLFGLNRLKMWLAANISNPFFAPTLLVIELQTGAFLHRGAFHPLTLHAARSTSLWEFGSDIAAGSVAVGVAIGLAAAIVTYACIRTTGEDADFLDLVRHASDRYLDSSIAAWEFARGKMRGDPLYRTVVCTGVLAGGGMLLDIGCGPGLTLALLAEARARAMDGTWPAAWGAPPIFERMVALDVRSRVIARAREALGPDAEIVEADARESVPAGASVVLMFDVLHMIPLGDQERVIDAALTSLGHGGVLLVREADASAGWRFVAVRIGNRLKAVAFGHWRQRFYFRTAADWQTIFRRRGLGVRALPSRAGTPFAGVLFRVTVASVEPAIARTPVHAG